MGTTPTRSIQRIRAGTVLAVLGHGYAVGGWLVWLHGRAGHHELAEPSFALHTLRDGTLALPLVAIALVIAAAVLPRLTPTGTPRWSSAALRLGVPALAVSLAFAAGGWSHGRLFGSTGHGEQLTFGGHLLRDTLLALPVALILAALLHLAGPMLRAVRRTLHWWSWRLVGAPAAAVALVAGYPGASPAAAALATAAAAAAPAGACPAGAPVARFDVTAIDVDIPLNRFGVHDPRGHMYVLNGSLAAVRAQESSGQVSIGERGDPIQPLVIRANMGQCVEIGFRNDSAVGAVGLHVDGLPFDVDSSGDAVGRNPASSVPRGGSATYTYYLPVDPTLEGAHYLHPGPGMRAAVSHGLFGALVVEPPGSTYLDPNAGDEAHARSLESGWEAIIRPGSGAQFREYVQLFHEIGDDTNDVRNQPVDRSGKPIVFVDPHTESYRPDTRAINYRSEAFMHRLDAEPRAESHTYASYTFSDPSQPWPRAYLADPVKFRLLHAGSEMFHVFHLHGGGDRWRFNPVADPTYHYADTGLNKHPVEAANSSRLDSQSVGPGESYNLEIEGGAGGVQQGAGDFLYHCHIAEHYVSGMWSFWRVYDTRQPDFAPLADRAAPPDPIESSALIGRTYGGQTVTAATLDDWIRPQLPPQGVRRSSQDAAVWDWGVDRSDPTRYLGEPEDTRTWPDYYNAVSGHPSALPGDRFVGDRPVLLFNPRNGRPAYPLLRPHLGMRPPFAPNGHSGAPYLGEWGDQAPRAGTSIDPWANRPDGICPARQADSSPTPLRRFNVVAVDVPIRQTAAGATDQDGKLFVLAHDKAAVLAGTKPRDPLALRANVGECVAVSFVNEQSDANASGGFSKVNMHIHHVQFDTQASDGVISGMQYEQSLRPYQAEDSRLTAASPAGASTISLSSTAKFQVGESIGVGLGREGPAATGTVNAGLSGTGPEIRTITSLDSGTLTLDRPLQTAHAAGEYAGVEFLQYRWYPDVHLDNIFWHDHVDGIHTWGHGLVGQLIIEPRGSTYHDPRSGAPIDSGTIADIHATRPLARTLVDGSFRELALWQLNDTPVGSTFNMRAAPWEDRVDPAAPDPSLTFSSYRWGDPITPLPRAYVGDPVVIRGMNVGSNEDTFRVDGHRFWWENRYTTPAGVSSTATDALHWGVSERFTMILRGGAGGPGRAAGDYLYSNGADKRFRQGAWGIIRVLPGRVADPASPEHLQPLPGSNPPSTGPPPVRTGGRPPAADPTGGKPCPGSAVPHRFDISAISLPSEQSGQGHTFAFVPSRQVADVQANRVQAAPLVLHVAAGECVTVALTNRDGPSRVSFHLAELLRTTASSGINLGYNPEQTVPRGQTRTFVSYADNAKIGAASISDFGTDESSAADGLYGAAVVAPAGSVFSDPLSRSATDVGAAVDVHAPDGTSYRDFTLLFADDDRQLGESFMPYRSGPENPRAVQVNYRQAPRADGPTAFSSAGSGDPPTPVLSAYAGDPVTVHALGSPGSSQVHVLSLGGHGWSLDPGIDRADQVGARGFGPTESIDAELVGGAGGPRRAVGDYFYGDLRRAFTLAGMWGVLRVLPAGPCPTQPGTLACLAAPPPDTTAPTVQADPPAGSYPGPVNVTLTASEPAEIRYTTDGTTPTPTSGSLYAGPISLTATATLRFLATDSAGNASPVTSAVYTIAAGGDSAPPTVTTPPTMRLASGQVTPGGAARVEVSWAASDPSGVASYAVSRSTDGGSDSAVPLPSPSATRVVLRLAPGHRYLFRLHATDGAGNTTPVAVSGTERTLTLVGDRDPAVRFSAGWRARTGSGFLGGSAMSTTGLGASATISLVAPSAGASLAWVTSVGPDHGIARLVVDGQTGSAVTVDGFARTAGLRRVLIATGPLPAGSHALTVVVAGKNPAATGRRVDVDGFVMLR